MNKTFCLILVGGVFIADFASCKKSTTCGVASETANAIDSTTVPIAVRDSFHFQYPAIDAQWYLEEPDYKASILLGSVKTTIIYSAGAERLQIETEIGIADLPSNVASVIAANFGSYTIKSAAKIDDLKLVITKYEAEVEKTDAHYDLIYDVNANLIDQIDLCVELPD